MITFRQIIESDASGILEILAANVDDRRAQGIAPFGTSQDLIVARLRSDQTGWVALMDGKPVGFAMAGRNTGELSLIAVRPDCQGWLDVLEDGERRLKKSDPGSVIKLEEHAVSDPATGYERIVRLQRGPMDRPHRLCLMLDGELYWRDMDAVPVLNDLCNQGRIPAVTIAFIGHVSGAARHEDYTCNERYGHYVDRIVAWLKSEVPSLQEDGHVICGLSLSGLMAVYLTLRYPQHFACCLSQSGSHWWRHEWFAKMAGQQARVAARFWLSVGDQETGVNVTHPPTGLFQEISQIAGVEKAVRVLEEVGGTVYFNQYQGGHSIESWRDELGKALPWLLTGPESAEPAVATDR